MLSSHLYCLWFQLRRYWKVTTKVINVAIVLHTEGGLECPVQDYSSA